MIQTVGDAMIPSVRNYRDDYSGSLIFSRYLGLMSIWCVPAGSCHQDLSFSTSLSKILTKRYDPQRQKFAIWIIAASWLQPIYFIWAFSIRCAYGGHFITMSHLQSYQVFWNLQLWLIALEFTAMKNSAWLFCITVRWNNSNLVCLWWFISLQCLTLIHIISDGMIHNVMN